MYIIKGCEEEKTVCRVHREPTVLVEVGVAFAVYSSPWSRSPEFSGRSVRRVKVFEGCFCN